MEINNITLKNFRNFDFLESDFDDVNIIWGENAQGKTNLIEAIYLFTGGRSFRGTKDKDLIKFNCDKSEIKIDFDAEGRSQNARIEIESKRIAYLNEIKKKSPAELSKTIKAVIFSPVHLSMVKDGPKERRQFTDTALCQIKSSYRNLLKEYNRALLQRNTLLKDLDKHPELGDMLSIWDSNLSQIGAKIIYQRIKYIDALFPYAENIYDGISSNREKISLKYKGCDDFLPDVEDIEKKLLSSLEKTRASDIENRSTQCGPHRDDMEILINGKSARTYGSQGQQRSCVLAIKLAEAALLRDMTGVEPIALLDDVMSELDEKRQDYILNHIKSSQVFITCCDKEQILRLKKGKTIHINDGKITD